MGLSQKGCIVLSFAVSVSFLVMGGILIPVFKKITWNQMKQKLPLRNGSESYNNWISPPVPIYFHIYLFNYLNADEIMAKTGIHPHVAEMGPYVYRETKEKFDVKFENGTISYRERKSYTFVPEKSSGMPDDTLYTPNIPAMAVINFLKAASYWQRLIANAFFMAEPLFKNLTVSDIVWGYRDSNVDKVRPLIKLLFNVTIPEEFGIFYGKNDTDDGVYTIYSGTEDITKLGLIKSWNGKSSVPYWNTPPCRQINGTDGTIFPPNRDENSVLYVFASDICRSINAIYEDKYKLDNIQLNRYIPPSNLFTTGDINPANKGFCTPKCLPSGLLNVSKCQQDAPVVLSQPHFYQASPDVIKSVKGLDPQKERHETRIGVEPMTGMVMDAAKRLQINLYVEKVSGVVPSTRIDKQVLPVLWIDESAKLDGPTADKFHSEVQVPIQMTFAIEYGVIGFGVFLFIFSLLLILRASIVNRDKYKNMSEEYSVPSTPTTEVPDINYDVPAPEMA